MPRNKLLLLVIRRQFSCRFWLVISLFEHWKDRRDFFARLLGQCIKRMFTSKQAFSRRTFCKNNVVLIKQYMQIFKLLLIAFSLFIISTVPQYGLYAIKSDIAILKSNLIALFTFLNCPIISRWDSIT